MTPETSSTETQTATPPVLEYGTQSTLRRRIRRGMFVCLALAAIVGGRWYAVPSVMHAIRLKSAIAECNAWAETARTSVLPEGTLLYSTSQSDFPRNSFGAPGMASFGSTPVRITTNAYISFADKHATLREVAYLAGGIPILSDFGNIVYVHEHPLWLAPPGSPPPIFSVYYIGLSSSGNPQFGVTSRMFPLDSKGQSNMVGGIATAPSLGIPMTNLRIFAGAPDPTDPTRFSIPFTCDGANGRFDFQTDIDPSDGGDVVPSISLLLTTWPTTAPVPE